MFFNDFYRGQRVLVTGNTGFKGGWLSTWLNGLGATVGGYSLDPPTSPSLFEMAGLAELIQHYPGDVRDPGRLNAVIREFRPTVIFHLAAQAIVSRSYSEPLETISTNVLGVATVLDCVRRLDQPCIAVIVTSDKCYENVEWRWGYREIDPMGGKDVYSASKGAAELIFRSFYRSFFENGPSGQMVVSARAGNVIGGGDWARDRIVVDCIRAWMKGEPVSIRSPNATRPWQHVLEPLSGYLWLAAKLGAEDALSGESFNFGPKPEQDAPVIELISDLAHEWGFAHPGDAFEVTGGGSFHEAGLLRLNCEKALSMLKWDATLRYSECMQMTAGWYRDVMRQDRPALEATRAQIDAYQDVASARGKVWAH